jgi:hypothetical protein
LKLFCWNAACEGGFVGHDGDRSQRCARARPADPNGLVPPSARQIVGSQEIRGLVVARKQLLGRLLDVELSIHGILRGFGLKVGQVSR